MTFPSLSVSDDKRTFLKKQILNPETKKTNKNGPNQQLKKVWGLFHEQPRLT